VTQTSSSAGNGPNCPANPTHGRMYSRDRGGDPSKGWRCMHSDHGGNGRPFTDQEVREYEIGEADMSQILESAARDVVAGTKTIDQATSEVAKATKRGAAQVREQIQEAVNVLQAQADAKAAEKAARAAAKAAKPVTPKGTAKPRGEHVEPAQFAAVRDRLGLSNKEVSAALLAAGMGNTLSRVTELTHSKGGSATLLGKYTEALETWRAANPAA
jgi:hypothetical protein